MLSDLDLVLLPIPKTEPPATAAPPTAATTGRAAPPVAATTATLAIAPPTTAKPLPILPSQFSLLSDSVCPIAVDSVLATDSLCEVASPTDLAMLTV